ncbi:MAG: hypothetical protein ABUL42_03970 [Terricaulis silvestris]
MKYDALNAYFAAQKSPRLSLSFDDVEKAARITLPASAFRYEAWWANDRTSHVQAQAWLDAGYRTESVDLQKKTVSFVRAAPSRSGVQEKNDLIFAHDASGRHPLLGAMRDTFTIEPGHDLAGSSLESHEQAEWDASLDRKAARGRGRKPT